MKALSRRELLAVVPAITLGRRLAAQNDTATFAADVKVVNIFATVRDKKGQIVKNLTKDDFVLEDEGQAQTIRYFSRESDLPLTLGLLVDTSGSVRNVLEDERRASYQFFDRVLREDRDKAFVIHFDFEVELLQDLTASRKLLDKALDELEVSQPRFNQRQGGGYPGGGGGGGGRGGYPGGRRRGGGTSLYDAILLASDELMRKQQGRKALILFSDGMDNGSKTTLADAIASAQRADTLVYSVLFADPNQPQNFGGFGGPGMGRRGRMGGGYPRPGGASRPDGKKIMQQLSEETGGRFFEVSHKEPIDKVYADIEEELRNEYNLGFSPAAGGGGFRKIHLTTKQKGLVVQARQGYYPA
jgi:VWFA-related protein